MKRLTTDDSNSIFLGINLFFAKDGEVWIRGGGPEPDYPDCTLTDWINRAAAVQGIELGADDTESLGDVMYDCLQYGVDATEGILALLHAAAVQAAEMRGRLASIEDILGDTYDIDRLRELVEADRDGKSMEHCKHVFAYDEVHTRTVCQKCGYVLTAEDKRRICSKGLELLEAEEREAADHVLKGEKNDRNWT